MLARIKNKFYQDTCGVKLNYLTLDISDKTIMQEFQDHKLAVQNGPFVFWSI